MNRIDQACPFSAEIRASQCQSCVKTSAPMPPCVVAWLSAEVRTTIPLNLVRLEFAQRRAA